MDFRQWFLSLSDEERESYAGKAGTTAGYIRVHLIGRRKIPRSDLMNRLAIASDGKWSVPALLAFFYRTREAAVDEADRTLAGAPQQAALLAERKQMRG